MTNPAKELLKKVSSVSAAAAALLSASNAIGLPTGDPETAKRTQDALDALKRATGAEADQVRFHVGGQLDPGTQEILLADHTSHVSHSSHSSGSYIRGSGSGDSSSTYTPSTNPVSAPSSTSATASTYSSTAAPAPAPTVSLAYLSGTRLSGSVIQKGSWGVQLLLKDATRIQVPRRKLRAEDIATLDLPAPTNAAALDVAAPVYLRLNDGQTYTGRVSAADGAQITMTADDNTSRTFQRTDMDPDTFIALQGLGPEISSPLDHPAPVAGVAAPEPITPVAIGQQVLIKLTSGTRMLVTLLSRSADEISIRTKDGHEYRLPASRLSTETLTALGMRLATDVPTPAPKRKKS